MPRCLRSRVLSVKGKYPKEKEVKKLTQYKIDEYAIRVWSSRSTTSLGRAVAGIYLYEGGKYRGHVYFFPDGTTLDPSVHHTATGLILHNFNLCQFHAVMEMLRNEKPIYLYYFDTQNAGLMCGREPVGEEE